MTNEQFMALESRVYRGGSLTPMEVLEVTRHARQLQQKIFCGDVFARDIHKFLEKYVGDIPDAIQWSFGNYICNKPETNLEAGFAASTSTEGTDNERYWKP